MLKNSGTQEKGKITYQKYANDAVKFISCGKIKNLIFQKNILFLAISKLRLSTYQCTPSGNPKLKFWLSLPIPKLFPYPLEKRLFKKLTYFLNSPFLCSVRDGE